MIDSNQDIHYKLKVTFPTDPISIENRLRSIDPIQYGKSRNYIDGAVTLLSPYIARGYLSTKQVFAYVSSLGYKPYQISKFVQELAWRDYFQEVWRNKGNQLFSDLKQLQPNILHNQIPKGILKETIHTGIPAIDKELEEFYKTGYLHNHVRMYIASIICNVGGAYWKQPSQWMYYHLLDADFASNTCSWQWVSGAFSSKKYVANQENINRYLKTNDSQTYLDKSYEEILQFTSIPRELETRVDWDLTEAYESTKRWFELKKISDLSEGINNRFFDVTNPLIIDPSLPVFLYDFYNLDPNWKKDTKANRIFILRPHFFKLYPSSPKTMDFIYSLSQNIEDIKFFWGEWNDLLAQTKDYRIDFFWKEHPTNKEYVGKEEPRDWLFPKVTGYFPSFFAYWKKCEKFWIHEDDRNPSLFQ